MLEYTHSLTCWLTGCIQNQESRFGQGWECGLVMIFLNLKKENILIWRSTVQRRRQPINCTKLWFFLNVLVAFTMLLADLHSNSWQRTHLATKMHNFLVIFWTKFPNKIFHMVLIFQLHRSILKRVIEKCLLLAPKTLKIFWNLSRSILVNPLQNGST